MIFFPFSSLRIESASNNMKKLSTYNNVNGNITNRKQFSSVLHSKCQTENYSFLLHACYMEHFQGNQTMW